jgi:thiol:disulfide interchange protein DsbC
MNIILRLFTLFIGIGAAVQVMANEDIAELEKSLSERLPQFEISYIKQTPIDGIYQVIIGGQVIYTTRDARYMIDGNLIDLSTKKNYSEDALSVIRLSQMDKLGEDKMVVYTPATTKHTITVVTDIDCPYCRRLHSEMDQYMAGGVKVRYIFMPLKGQSDYRTTVSVWCAKDQNGALDLAKSGAELEPKDCENPIDEHLSISRNLGVRGTPAIILQDGSMLPGYVPAGKLIAELAKLDTPTAKASTKTKTTN